MTATHRKMAKAALKELETSPSGAIFRHMMRVEKADKLRVWLGVPGLDTAALFEVRKSQFPEAFRKELVKGYRFYARVDSHSASEATSLRLYPPFEPGGKPRRAARLTHHKLMVKKAAKASQEYETDPFAHPEQDPLNVKVGGVPPCLRPEEIKDIRVSAQMVQEFIEGVLYATVGSTVLSSTSKASEAINRLVRLKQMMDVADARIAAGRSAA